eukprot:gene9962-biopygen6787
MDVWSALASPRAPLRDFAGGNVSVAASAPPAPRAGTPEAPIPPPGRGAEESIRYSCAPNLPTAAAPTQRLSPAVMLC